ncbi:22932_t:CDS:10 [Dentiscutata erythropus]|uniref:22932_t:CDS:1 n=1 Tax=Dentiscutata erythropus TaxID=1348616 RepID=A0A9N9AX91_9GLOM|nr:22932_t:CDS:10 [Dentiscutata erythropus]
MSEMDFDLDTDLDLDKGKGRENLVESPQQVAEESVSGDETAIGEYAQESNSDEDDDEAEGGSSVTDNNAELGRKEEEFLRKDRSLLEFLLLLDNFEPLIPEFVTEYYLNRSGIQCDDVRVMRLMSLAAQKFVADIATDAFQYCKIRQQSKKNVGKTSHGAPIKLPKNCHETRGLQLGMASQIQTPNPGEVTVAEIDGRLLQLKKASDPNIEVYVRAEGVLFPQLQIPNDLKSPETLHQSRRVIVQNLPPRNVLSKTAQKIKDFVGCQFKYAKAVIGDFARIITDILPNYLSNSIFDVDTIRHMQSLCNIKNQYPSKILAWHPYISLFAVAHNVDVVFLYDLRVEAWFPEALETTLQKEITCMAWKPLGGNILAVGCRRGICLWELTFNQKKSSGESSSFNAWMRYLNSTGSSDGSIILWNTSFGNGTVLTTRHKVVFLSWSPVGEFLFSSFLDGRIEVYETQRWTSKAINTSSQISSRRPVQTACWTADGRALFLSFCEDQYIRCLSISPNLDGEWFPKEDMSYIPNCAGRTIEQLAIDPTGERLAVCFKDTELLVVFHAKRPTQVSRGSSLLSAQGIVRGPSWNDPSDPGACVTRNNPKAVSINFAHQFTRGALLSLVWEDGQISFLPFLFRPIGK